VAAVCRYSSADGAQLDCFGGGPIDPDSELRPSMSATGELAFGFRGGEQHSVLVRRNDGTVWKVTLASAAGGKPGIDLASVTAEPGGDAVVSGTASAGFVYDGQAVGPGAVLLRIQPDGHLAWWRSIAAQLQLATDGDGTIVGIFRNESSVNVNGLVTAAGTYLLAVEADGTPRWVIALPSGSGGLAVLPSGDVAAYVNRDGCGGLVVSRFSRTGDLRWSRDFASDGCNAEGQSIAILPDETLVSGALEGAVDFGTGPLFAEGFLVDLRG
jgi:hypothetical protein